MNILIKGIDIPKENSIIIEIDEDGEVYEHITGGQPVHIKPWVKAIQIPTPHGRLIDADKLRATLRRWTEDEWNQKASPVSWAYAYEDLIDLIDDAPTILEEEG